MKSSLHDWLGRMSTKRPIFLFSATLKLNHSVSHYQCAYNAVLVVDVDEC